MHLKLSKYIVHTDIINPDESEDSHNRVIYSTKLCRSILVKDAIFKKLIAHAFDQIDLAILNQLVKTGILVPKEEDEFAVIFSENTAAEKQLSLAIHTTSNCQLGCSYCGQKHQAKKLDISVIDKLLSYAEGKLQAEQFNSFNIIWTGGEPLEALSEIIEISNKALTLADKYYTPLNAMLVTNGVLLNKEVFEKTFFECNIKAYQITLDGVQEAHDKKRSTKDGQPTFDIIFDNINRIINEVRFTPSDGIIFQIKVNVDRMNGETDSIINLIDKFALNGFQNRVTFQFKPVANYADNKKKESEGYKMSEFAELEIEYEFHALQNGFTLDLLPRRKLEPCFAVGKNSAVIDVNGDIFSCYAMPYTEHVLAENNKIGNLLSESSSFNEQTSFRNWFKELNEKKGVCFECNLFPVCGGGCRLQWEEGEIGCPSFKYNIEDKLILNYLYRNSGLAKSV